MIRENETYQICIRLFLLSLLLRISLRHGCHAAFIGGLGQRGIICFTARRLIEQSGYARIERHDPTFIKKYLARGGLVRCMLFLGSTLDQQNLPGHLLRAGILLAVLLG